MTDQPTVVTPHSGISYTEQGFGLLAGFDVVLREKGLDITGVCPACRGRTVSSHEIGSPHGYKGIFPRRRAGSAPKPPAGPVTVICACGFPHAERPAESGESGCGAYWKVTLP
ncbi:hypothetical protein V6U90_25010 [Micromonospora sp. CPCC 206060]|uniref:hypothetical protein n=1 Tax=Micromonospora sp. CPCC 206060 TaxID=3122406 RepID=UPI002FEFA093